MYRVPDKEIGALDVAVLCDVHINTVWRWIQTGQLPATRKQTAEGRRNSGKGVAYCIKASDLAAFMEKRNAKKK